MNATTIDAPRAKAAAKRTRPAQAQPAVVAVNHASLFGSLFEVIEAAWAIDDTAYPTDACILLKMAKDIAHDSRSMGLDEIGVRSAAYDIAALLKAVTSMPDQSRNGMLEPAYPLLAILADDPDVMTRSPGAHQVMAASSDCTDLQQEALWEIDGLCDMSIAFEKTVSNEDSSARTSALRRIKFLAGVATYCHTHITGEAADVGAPAIDEMRHRVSGYY